MRDSVHSDFAGRIEVDEKRNVIIANGNTIHLIYSKSPDTVDYPSYGIENAVVLDNTGIWRDQAGLKRSVRRYPDRFDVVCFFDRLNSL